MDLDLALRPYSSPAVNMKDYNSISLTGASTPRPFSSGAIPFLDDSNSPSRRGGVRSNRSNRFISPTSYHASLNLEDVFNGAPPITSRPRNRALASIRRYGSVPGRARSSLRPQSSQQGSQDGSHSLSAQQPQGQAYGAESTPSAQSQSRGADATVTPAKSKQRPTDPGGAGSHRSLGCNPSPSPSQGDRHVQGHVGTMDTHSRCVKPVDVSVSHSVDHLFLQKRSKRGQPVSADFGSRTPSRGSGRNAVETAVSFDRCDSTTVAEQLRPSTSYGTVQAAMPLRDEPRQQRMFAPTLQTPECYSHPEAATSVRDFSHFRGTSRGSIRGGDFSSAPESKPSSIDLCCDTAFSPNPYTQARQTESASHPSADVPTLGWRSNIAAMWPATDLVHPSEEILSSSSEDDDEDGLIQLRDLIDNRHAASVMDNAASQISEDIFQTAMCDLCITGLEADECPSSVLLPQQDNSLDKILGVTDSTAACLAEFGLPLSASPKTIYDNTDLSYGLPSLESSRHNSILSHRAVQQHWPPDVNARRYSAAHDERPSEANTHTQTSAQDMQHARARLHQEDLDANYSLPTTTQPSLHFSHTHKRVDVNAAPVLDEVRSPALLQQRARMSTYLPARQLDGAEEQSLDAQNACVRISSEMASRARSSNVQPSEMDAIARYKLNNWLSCAFQ